METKLSGFSYPAIVVGTTGDSIPKEFHRRVLKKIAQLTKVVYTLHTKNDANEEEIESMKEEHMKDKQRLESERDSKSLELNEERNRNRDLENKIASLQSEKDHLLQDHNTFVDDAEKRLQLVIEDESHKLVKMKMEVSLWKDKLHVTEKELEGLQKESAEAIESHKARESQLELRLGNLESQWKQASEDYEKNMDSLKNEHDTEISKLMTKHEEEMDSLRQSMSHDKDTAVRLEIEALEHKYKSQDVQRSENEVTLTERLSKLSKELVQARDELAVSQQRERELQIMIDEGTVEHSGLMEKERDRVKQLQHMITEYEERLEKIKETCQSQELELKEMTEHTYDLESVKTKLQNERDRLSNEVNILTNNLQELEENRNTEMKQYEESLNELSQKVHDLENEINQLLKEKKALHSQYAHEIEAAHSCLSEREVALTEKHSVIIQQMVYNHQTELNRLKSEHDVALATLHSEYESKLSEQQSQADLKYEETTSDMSLTIANKESECTELRNNLEAMKTRLTDKERELSTNEERINKCNEQNRVLRNQVIEKNTQGNNLGTRINKLQASYDSLHKEFEQMIQKHKIEISKTEKTIRERTEIEMTKRANAELSRVRNQLENQFTEASQRELSTVIELKNRTIKDCEEKWSKENSNLMKQISELEKEIVSIKEASEMEITSLRDQCQQETEKLTNKYDEQLREIESAKSQLIANHLMEIEKLRTALENIHKASIENINSDNQRVLLETHQANRLAMDVLRIELMAQKEEEKKEMKEIHEQEIDKLREELMDHLTTQLEEARLKYETEQENNEKIAQAEIDNLNAEILRFESFQESLKTQFAECNTELIKVKDKLSLMAIELNDKRKELEMSQRELQVTQIESKNQLKLTEEQLRATHAYEMESVICQHKHESQLMLNEFNKAKEILSMKLHTAEKKLHVMEMKYKSRESRPEDVAAIHELCSTVKDMERKIKDLITEKKVYEMELMNREKNYNKLFNSNPQIGVLDPLKGKRRSSPASTKPHPNTISNGVTSHSISSIKSDVTSLPSITSITSQDYRDIPSSSPKQHQSQPSLFTHIPPKVPSDISPRATASSPHLIHQSPRMKPHVITRTSHSPSLMSKRSIKFLTDDTKVILKQEPAALSRTKSNPDTTTGAVTSLQQPNSIVA